MSKSNKKKLENLGWQDYDEYSIRCISFTDSAKYSKILQFYSVSKRGQFIICEHIVIDKYGNIVHYGLHRVDKEDFVSKYKVEFDQNNLNFIYKKKTL
jgi:hypothetical protein